MPAVAVGALRFTFPDDWIVSKYDDWSFYRNGFINVQTGTKALDLLVVDPARTAWLIEVKDYRAQPRTKPLELADEIARKTRDTLAALLPAQLNGVIAAEAAFAKQVLGAHLLRVVLHLEQPAKHSKLFPRAIDPADVQMKLRQRVKSIDPHPMVVETAAMRGLAWRVS